MCHLVRMSFAKYTYLSSESVLVNILSFQVLRYKLGNWEETELLLFPRLAYVASVQV